MHPEGTAREVVLRLAGDPVLRRRFLVVNEAIPGNLRFGVLLEELDRLAGDAALGYARSATPAAFVVTAAVDEIVVRRVADASADLRCRAHLNSVGRSSMEVGIRIETAPEGAHLASCYFTMVAREGEGSAARSLAVPPLELATERDRIRAGRAEARREAYRQARTAATEPPSREEFDLVASLHRAQQAPGFSGLRSAQLVTESWDRTYPEQENAWKTIFGGYLMRRAYELSAICAERVASHRPVIAAVNRINFFHPVQIGDKLRFTSRVVYTSGPAICVETAIERHSRDRNVRALSNSCLFTFVNVGPDLRRHDVPPVHPTDFEEDARLLEARRNLAGLARRFRSGWLGPEQ